jgi:hypothetical protein
LLLLLAEDFLGEEATSLRVLFQEEQNRLDLRWSPPSPLRAAPDVPLIVFAEAAEKDYAAQSLKDGALG